MSVIGFTKLLRVGGSVASSTIDSHGCDRLHAGLRGDSDVGCIVSVSVGTGDVGEWVTALLRLATGSGEWTGCGTVDDGLVGCVG